MAGVRVERAGPAVGEETHEPAELADGIARAEPHRPIPVGRVARQLPPDRGLAERRDGGAPDDPRVPERGLGPRFPAIDEGDPEAAPVKVEGARDADDSAPSTATERAMSPPSLLRFLADSPLRRFAAWPLPCAAARRVAVLPLRLPRPGVASSPVPVPLSRAGGRPAPPSGRGSAPRGRPTIRAESPGPGVDEPIPVRSPPLARPTTNENTNRSSNPIRRSEITISPLPSSRPLKKPRENHMRRATGASPRSGSSNSWPSGRLTYDTRGSASSNE